MIRLAFCIGLSGLIVSTAAVAQSIEACKKIAADKERLVCFDALPIPKAPGVTSTKSVADPFARIKGIVTASLKDPASAQFRNIYKSKKDGNYVCGEVNAKNSYGGFTGFKTFIYNALDQGVHILDQAAPPQEKLKALEAANACEFPLSW